MRPLAWHRLLHHNLREAMTDVEPFAHLAPSRSFIASASSPRSSSLACLAWGGLAPPSDSDDEDSINTPLLTSTPLSTSHLTCLVPPASPSGPPPGRPTNSAYLAHLSMSIVFVKPPLTPEAFANPGDDDVEHANPGDDKNSNGTGSPKCAHFALDAGDVKENVGRVLGGDGAGMGEPRCALLDGATGQHKRCDHAIGGLVHKVAAGATCPATGRAIDGLNREVVNREVAAGTTCPAAGRTCPGRTCPKTGRTCPIA